MTAPHVETLDEILAEYEGSGFSAEKAALRAAIALMRGREGWRPIETAPRDGTWVLVWDRYLGVRLAKYEEPEGLFGDALSWFLHPTHWQPLPAAPTTTGEAQG